MKKALLLSVSLLVALSSFMPNNISGLNYTAIAGRTLATVGTLAATISAVATTAGISTYFGPDHSTATGSMKATGMFVCGTAALTGTIIACPSIAYASKLLLIPQSTFYKWAGLGTIGTIAAYKVARYIDCKYNNR